MRDFLKWMGIALAFIVVMAVVNLFYANSLSVKRFAKFPYKGISEEMAMAAEKHIQKGLGDNMTAEEEGWRKGSNIIQKKYKDKDGTPLFIFITTEKIISLRREDGSLIMIEDWGKRNL